MRDEYPVVDSVVPDETGRGLGRATVRLEREIEDRLVETALYDLMEGAVRERRGEWDVEAELLRERGSAAFRLTDGCSSSVSSSSQTALMRLGWRVLALGLLVARRGLRCGRDSISMRPIP